MSLTTTLTMYILLLGILLLSSAIMFGVTNIIEYVQNMDNKLEHSSYHREEVIDLEESEYEVMDI